MRRTPILGTAVLVAAMALAACNRDDTAQAPAAADTAANRPPGSGSGTEEGFAKAAAVGDMYDIASNRLALQRSKSESIKDFAQEMIDAHAMTSNRLKSIVMSSPAKVEPPAALDGRRNEMMENLRGAADEDFDGSYLNQQINAHQEALILFRSYADSGDTQALKQFAAETAPVIEQHLEMAKALDKSGVDNKPVGGPLIPANE